MPKLLSFFRGTAAVIAGLFVAAALLMAGREIAFGDGQGLSPADLGAGAQLLVGATWAIAAASATWLAIRLSQRQTPGLVACAWLFQTAWLSPGVRPAEVWMRLACAAAVAFAGFAVMFWHRHRVPLTSRPTVTNPLVH